jgi:hypothetical protein
MLVPEVLEQQVVLILAVDQMVLTHTLVELQVLLLLSQLAVALVEVDLQLRAVVDHQGEVTIKILEAEAQLQVQLAERLDQWVRAL